MMSIRKYSSMLCVHLNIRSMRENFDSFLLELSQLDELPLIIVLSEVWIYENELDIYKIDGYHHYANCNDSYRAGGIVVYVKDGINVNHDKLNFISADGLKLYCTINNTNICVLAFYRFTGVSADIFVRELSHALDQIIDECVILTGDINVDLTSTARTVDEYKFMMNSYGFDSYINTPTRITGRTSSCIDHLYIRASPKILNLMNFEGTVCHNNITDHSMIKLFANLTDRRIPDNAQDSNNFLSFKQRERVDNNKFLKEVQQTDWSVVYQCSNVDLAYDNFIVKIKDCLQKSLHKFTFHNKKNKFRKPWMNNNLLKKIEKKNTLYRKLSLEPENVNIKLEYYTLCKNLKKELSDVKEKYYQDTCSKLKGDSKTAWKIVDSLIGLKKKSIEVKEISNEQGELITDKGRIAEEFNKYFVNIVSTLDFNPNDSPTPQTYRNRFKFDQPSASFFFMPTCPIEIQQVIDDLKLKKSPGKDGIATTTIKAAKEFLSVILSHIFNLSFESGTFPRQMKEAVVITIFKGGDTRNMSNYRPIALLSVFSKIFEKLVRNRIQNFLNASNFYSPNQFGFRAGLRTEDAMRQVLSKFYNGINDSKKVAGLFLDIKKAYDCVNHTILLRKLQDAGIRGICNDWFKSFLSDRTQQVEVGGCLSDVASIGNGVPQGSALSSELFLIYINDLCDGRFNGAVTSYADDTALCYAADTDAQLKTQIREDLEIINYWLHQNSLRLNIGKTKILMINLHQQPLSFSVPFHVAGCNDAASCSCEHIDEVNNLKYLGITIDSQLSWGTHISNLKLHLIIACRKFYYLRNLCPINILIMLYYALVESRLQYGITIWGGAYFTTLSPLLVGQKFIIRVICKKPARHSSLVLFRAKEILPLRYLYFFKVLEVFFERSGLSGGALLYSHPALRAGGSIIPPRPKKEKFRRCFLYVAPRVYNVLPFEIRAAEKLNRFKYLLKKWLLEKDSVETFF